MGWPRLETLETLPQHRTTDNGPGEGHEKVVGNSDRYGAAFGAAGRGSLEPASASVVARPDAPRHDRGVVVEGARNAGPFSPVAPASTPAPGT